MVAAQRGRTAAFDRSAHGFFQFKAHEMDCRSLFVIFAVQVFIGDSVDRGVAIDFDDKVLTLFDHSLKVSSLWRAASSATTSCFWSR